MVIGRIRISGFVTLLIISLISGLVFGGSVYAQKAEGKAKETAPAPAKSDVAAKAAVAGPAAAAAEKTQDFSDGKIDAFLQVDAAAQRINIEANRQIRAALEAAGITVEEYNAIVRKLTQEAQFLERVKQRAMAMMPQPAPGEKQPQEKTAGKSEVDATPKKQ